MISTIGRWTIEHQPDVTRQCYEARPEGPGCNCADCQNFMAALDKAFPREFLSLAELLGIDLGKPAELSHYGQDNSASQYLTGGWYHVAAKILSGRDAMRQTSETSGEYDMEKLAGDFEFGFTNNLALVSPPFADKQVVQLEFMTRVPWVLSEPKWQIPNP